MAGKTYKDFFKAAKAQKTQGDSPVQSSMGGSSGSFFASSSGSSSSSSSAFSSASSSASSLGLNPLRGQLRRKFLSQKNSKRKSSRGVITVCTLSLILFAMGYQNSEAVDRWLSSVEIKLLGAALANSEASAAKKEAGAPSAAGTGDKASGQEATTGRAQGSGEKTTELSEADMGHFQKLMVRKKELDAREAELQRIETELAEQKSKLDQRLQELEKTRRSITSVLEERIKADEQKIDNLVQMYSSMKPQQAASVFEKMDEDLAVEILGRMKKKSAADILNLVKAEKAQILSEKYAGYRSPQSSNVGSSNSGSSNASNAGSGNNSPSSNSNNNSAKEGGK